MRVRLLCYYLSFGPEFLTSDSPLKETVLGFFYSAEIVAGVLKIKK